jgi:hypothetical protein
VRARLHELYPQWNQARSSPHSTNGENPRKATLDQNRRFDLVSEEPAKLNAPLFIVSRLDDLFGTRELLVARHLADARAKVLRGESGETDGVESFDFCFRPELDADLEIGADFADRSPQCEEFFGLQEYA